jgi:carbamoyl-phosphate synthase small subunit
MTEEPKAWLALENGLVLEGRSVGASGERRGDLVFNTAMTGYHEILTDPSYAGQGVVMTYPLIGNYGVPREDDESGRAWAEAFVIKEMSRIPSNRRSDLSLSAWLSEQGVVAIDGVDTRRLTKAVRTEGCLRFALSTQDSDPRSLVAKAKGAPNTDGRDLASEVCTKQPYSWSETYGASYPHWIPPANGKRVRCVAYDFGAKRNILRSLVHTGFDVTVVPAWTTADEVLGMDPEAIFLSNGPGDPAAVERGIAAVSDLIGKKPIFGICLGHQILGLAVGGDTFKLKFGHRGANHPVKELESGKVEITSQNHGFAVDPQSLPAHIVVTHENLYDGTVEGFRHKDKPIYSVQYHPEASPGPHDADYLFQQFLDSMEKR